MPQQLYRSGFGFTVIEITITIMVLSILLTIIWGSVGSYLVFARDNERESDASSIIRSMERYYRSQSSSGISPSYPTVTQVNTPIQRSLFIPDNDTRLYSPGQSAVSLSAATSTASPVPTMNQYIYQPFTETDTVCTAPADTPCVRYLLFYRSERTNAVITLESDHQQ